MSKHKEKALGLFESYYMYVDKPYETNAKQCAILAVENEYNAKIQAYNEMSEFCLDIAAQAVFYAQKELKEIKSEIEKL